MLQQLHRLQPDRLERFALRSALGLVAMVVAGTCFALLAGLVTSRWEPLYAADRAVTDALNEMVAGSGLLLEVLQALTDFGGAAVLVRVLILATAFLLIRREVRLAAYVVVTSLGALILDPVLKLLVGRLRPVVAEPVATAPGMSFPSGHSMGSLVSYGVLLLVFLPIVPRRLRAPAVAAVASVVVLVGFTRVALGVHHLSDVLGGWLLGLVWLGITAVAFRHWRVETGLNAPPLGEGLAPEDAPALEPVPAANREPLPHPWRGAAELLTAWVLLLGALFGIGTLVTRAADGTVVAAADKAVVRWFAEVRTPALDQVAAFGSWLGNTQWIMAGTLAACALATAVLRRWRPVLFLLVVMAGELTLFLVSAAAVGRSRPTALDSVPAIGPELPPTSGFPSGHVAAAAALYTAIAVLVWRSTGDATGNTTGDATGSPWRWAAVAAAVLVPLLCALARMYRGAHYPTDVLAGLLLALPWVTAAWWVLLRPRPAATDRAGKRAGKRAPTA